jgi:hypothetical protein
VGEVVVEVLKQVFEILLVVVEQEVVVVVVMVSEFGDEAVEY